MSDSILAQIGNTPLVEIKHLNPNPDVKILAKLEYFNPGGSIKDRPALYMIEEGEKSGELTQDKTVLEATSGNTGIGLALVCSAKGYNLTLAMSEAVSVERQKILKARGADIILTPGHLGTDGAIEAVYKLARENPDRYFITDQYNNPANWKAHYHTTAEEILNQTGGKFSKLVATVGTSGTLMGLSRKLKEVSPDVEIICVEPYLGHGIQGLKNMKEAYQPELFEKKRLDLKISIEDEHAFDMARALAKKEGIFVGMSSGAAMYVAAEQAKQMDKGTIVVIFPDGGERYLSTVLYSTQTTLDLRLYNTMTGKKEPVIPVRKGSASVYSCGPTVHERLNISLLRRYLYSDLICRYVESNGFSVNHVINITDLDDRTIEGCEKEEASLKRFTEKYTNFFLEDLELLNIRPASTYAKVSDHTDIMIKRVEQLIEKGFAYEKLRSVYFNISALPEYGILSGINLNKIKLGITVDLDEYEKDNPRDFTLFKRSRLSELKKGLCIQTKWGNVRPSLHIQCAAIIMEYLGDECDIHMGSRELIFPHHENEQAISQALKGKTLARVWSHCGHITSQNQDISLLTLPKLSEMGFTARQIRFFVLFTHYRKEILFSEERVHETSRVLAKIDDCIHTLLTIDYSVCSSEIDYEQIMYDLKTGFVSSLNDDLNISKALSAILQAVKHINALMEKRKIGKIGAGELIKRFREIDDVLKVFDFRDRYSEPEIIKLMKERESARVKGDFSLADEVRKKLIKLGVKPRDEKYNEVL